MQVIKLNGDHLTFKGRVYGSVGIEYRIEYEKLLFKLNITANMYIPKKIGTC